MANKIHTIWPGFIPEGYFDDDNIEFIRNRTTQLLNAEFKQNVVFDRASVVRLMERVLGEEIQSIPRMNERVIMYMMDEFKNHQMDANKHLKWEGQYLESQRLYDPTINRGPDLQRIKLANRLGRARVGGTSRFYFT